MRVETDLKATLSATILDFIKLGAEGASRLTEEQRQEITHHGQEVVHKTQMSKLTQLFNAIDEEILTDSKKNYYIVVDQLDEDWADDSIRYHLIRSLIETMREMNSKIRFAKIIIALRVDLLDLVLQTTTDSGFQDEKYRGLCIPVTWSRTTLEKLLNNRVNELVKSRYTGKIVTYKDLLPQSIRKTPTIEYMLDRTLLRPRDLITFFNICIEKAENETQIDVQQLVDAEGQYSQERLRSLADEWSTHFSSLRSMCNLLKKRKSSFKLNQIDKEDLLELCVVTLDPDPQKQGEDIDYIRAYNNNNNKASVLRSFIAQVLYRVGIVGLKTDGFKEISWSNKGLNLISPFDINDNTLLCIHPMFWRALGINATNHP